MALTKIEILEKIIYLNKLMNQTNDFTELLNIILIETEKMLEVEGTSILLEDKETGNLYFYVVTGTKKDILNSIRLQKSEGVCGYVFKSGNVVIENNPEKSKFFTDKVDKETKFKTRNLLGVPLQIKGKTIGVIELVNKINRNFNESDVEFLNAIASQVSITLERARLVKEKIKSERLATIGETVAGLAHFIKNILNGLRGGAFIINKNLKKIESKKLQMGWDMVQKNINKISSLALDMLEFSKERKPEYKLLDINSTIDSVIQLISPRAKKSGIIIKKELQKDLEKFKYDENGIFRCLLNLITNALDAMEGRENSRIKITSMKDRNFARIEIKDNGGGIKEELLDKLFTKYFSTKGSKGTGLGLPITKKIIDEHKGTIKCISKINKGTTFIIRLPFKK